MSKITLPGKLDIHVPNRSDCVERVEITILDADAGVEVATVSVDLAGFALALTGRGRIPCEITVSRWGLDRVGTREEHKREFVPDIGAEPLRPFLVDGWRPVGKDFGNHHKRTNRDGVDGYMVQFSRNVPKDADEKGEE